MKKTRNMIINVNGNEKEIAIVENIEDIHENDPQLFELIVYSYMIIDLARKFDEVNTFETAVSLLAHMAENHAHIYGFNSFKNADDECRHDWFRVLNGTYVIGEEGYDQLIA